MAKCGKGEREVLLKVRRVEGTVAKRGKGKGEGEVWQKQPFCRPGSAFLNFLSRIGIRLSNIEGKCGKMWEGVGRENMTQHIKGEVWQNERKEEERDM